MTYVLWFLIALCINSLIGSFVWATSLKGLK